MAKPIVCPHCGRFDRGAAIDSILRGALKTNRELTLEIFEDIQRTRRLSHDNKTNINRRFQQLAAKVFS